VILHGSAGIDARVNFYADALNAAGVATLDIDMWEARGVTGLANRPRAPILTYPDAFAALRYLTTRPEIDAARIGVIGFSWGGVMSLGAAEQLYAAQFGGGLHFAAHVAHYPVCYGANNAQLVAPLSPAQAGTQFLNLTGAPVLIQIGSNDDYDNGTQHCNDIAASVNSSGPVEVNGYDGAYHAWDRLMVPVTALDPFGNEGSILTTGVVPTVRIVPNVDLAYEARRKAVRFFLRHL
jgi:dienelactone hydrolase